MLCCVPTLSSLPGVPQESLPPLPAEPSPGALPPLPPDEDQPPLPPSEATETRLATAGLFEPATHAATEPFHPQLPPMPSTGIGMFEGF